MQPNIPQQAIELFSSLRYPARFAIRGGRYDETLVNLDGQELMEPFHLKDFQGIFSILDPEMIGGVEFTRVLSSICPWSLWCGRPARGLLPGFDPPPDLGHHRFELRISAE